MGFRFSRAATGERVVFTLSGRIEAKHIAEVQSLFDRERRSVLLDLKEVDLVDRDVVRFLARSEAGGIGIDNCHAYIREWILREQ